MVDSAHGSGVEMETHHLLYFITVAEELHFGHAALKLHIAQPPLSRHIKALEGYLGVELFYRDRRHVRLTAAGEAFLPTAREILRLIHAAAEETSRSIPPPTGVVTVAVPTQSSHSLVREIVGAFATEVPTVALQMTVVAPDDLSEALRSGFADIGLLYVSGSSTGPIAEENFYEDTATAVLWKGHRLSRRKAIRLRELAREPWILYQEPLQKRDAWQFLRRCSTRVGFELNVAMTTNSLTEAMAAVDRKEGVSIIPRGYDCIAHLSRRYVPIDSHDLCVPLGMYRRKDDKQAILEALLHIARQICDRRSRTRPAGGSRTNECESTSLSTTSTRN